MTRWADPNVKPYKALNFLIQCDAAQRIWAELHPGKPAHFEEVVEADDVLGYELRLTDEG